ncbi:MAG TPA: glycosyltransferase family 4 protein [Dermatophilaceae bacterium]|nr:glycosyltransferase family 4 protein [Dermatophilaceae bacterium]
MPHLVFVATGPILARDGSLIAPVKLVEGLQAYAARFPGELTLLGVPAQHADADNLGVRSTPLADLGFGCVVDADVPAALARLRPDVALVDLSESCRPLLGIATATVAEVEHTGASRLAMALAQPHSPVDRIRLEVGYRRLQRRLERLADTVDGLICNGALAWQAFGSRATPALRVYDNRVRAAWVEQAAANRSARPRRPADGGLRLGFSGRLVPIKGPEYAVRLVDDLLRRGIDARLHVLGDGPLAEALKGVSGPTVTWHGSLDFATAWPAFVQKHLDVMVLPHVQADPSGSYLESAGLGVPVLGFDNAQLADLVGTAGLGWTVPMRDGAALADRAASLANDPGEIERAGAAGIAFVREHCFERDFDARVDFLVEQLRRQR